jgi:hypothetical protein
VLLGVEVRHGVAVFDAPHPLGHAIDEEEGPARVVLPAPPWPTRATLRILAEGNVFTSASGATVGPPVTGR